MEFRKKIPKELKAVKSVSLTDADGKALCEMRVQDIDEAAGTICLIGMDKKQQMPAVEPGSEVRIKDGSPCFALHGTVKEVKKFYITIENVKHDTK